MGRLPDDHRCYPNWVNASVLLACGCNIVGVLLIAWFFVNAKVIHFGVIERFELSSHETWMCLSGALLATCWK